MSDHLEDTQMTYWQHWCFAMCYAKCCLKCAAKLFIHAWLPDVFPTAGKDLACRMQKDFNCEQP